MLSRGGGPGGEELDATLRRLREAGLVVEIAYGELPETRRRRLHAGVAAALEALRPDDAQRLAHHYRGAAGEADPVVPWTS